MDTRKLQLTLAGLVVVGCAFQFAQADDSAAVKLLEAEELYRQGYYDRSIEAYEPLLNEKPAGAKAAVGIARPLRQLGRYEEALEHLDAVREEGVHSADWQWGRARLLRVVGRYPEAITHCRKAVEIDEQHYAARYLLGELYEIVGNREETIRTYQWFNDLLKKRLPHKAEDITYAGRGFYRYSQLTRHSQLTARTRHVLQELYQGAYEKVDRTYWPARLAAAELLLAKHKLDEAAQDFKAALKINKNLPRAHTGIGRTALERWDFSRAENAVKEALAINPRYVPAMTLLASTRMTERKYSQAAEECDKALAVNPNDIEALSIKAAALIRQGDEAGARQYVDRVEKINPRCGLAHFIIGTWLSAARQFPEAEARFFKAIEWEPEEPDHRTELGLMYMQWGYEAKARAALEAAWELDAFNQQTYNTLELLETLEGFEVYESEHFLIKYRGQRDGILGPYFARYLESIYQDMVEDYGAVIEEKTIIEIFPRHEQFAVRITGKPWIHTIGASTGRVIAMDAPHRQAHTSGPFHWARVLRHEFTHTVTLAATRNRIPHWFTEGLAVLQEDTPRSWGWVEILTGAIRRDRLFTLESIDWGFIRPRTRMDRPLAYAQSEWMCEYIIEKHGYATINKMLARFRDGWTQERVFRELLGSSPEAFSTSFKAWAIKEAGRWGLDISPYENEVTLKAALLLKSKDASLHAKLAEKKMSDGEYDKAARSARKALELDPDETRALAVVIKIQLQRAAREKRKEERASLYDEVRTLGRHLVELAPKHPAGPRALAKVALERRDWAEATKWYERLKRVCPKDEAGYRGMAAIHLEQGRPDRALPELIQLARMDEKDVLLRRKIGSLLEKKGQDAGAIHWFTEALYIDPYAPQTHKDLARLYTKANRFEEAAMEYRVLCEIEPDAADHFAQLAFAYDRWGKKDEARQAAEKAVALNADSPAKRLLE